MTAEVQNFDAVRSVDELKTLVDTLMESEAHVGFDIETGYSGEAYPSRSLNPHHDSQFICGFSITNSTDWARYVPLLHDYHDSNIDPNVAWELVKPVLETKTIVAHNIVFEANNLMTLEQKGHGPNIRIPVRKAHDSMIQAFMLSDVPKVNLDTEFWNWCPPDDPQYPLVPSLHYETCDNCSDFVMKDTKRILDGLCRDCAYEEGVDVDKVLKQEKGRSDRLNTVWGLGLKDLTNFRYGYRQSHIETLFGETLTTHQEKTLRFNVLPINPQVVSYACDDALWCLRLSNDQLPRIEGRKSPRNGKEMMKFLYSVEMEIADMLVDMNLAGIAVDWDGIEDNNERFKGFYADMQSRTRKLFEQESGESLADMNFGSVKQLRKLLYSDMGLDTTVLTGTDEKSTSERALTMLRKESKAVDQLLLTRQCKKVGDFFTAWHKLSDQYTDNRIHPSFGKTTIPTGRFNSSGPNVQQIQKHWWYQLEEGTEDEVREMGEDKFWTGNARAFIVPTEGYRLLSFDYQAAEMRVLAGLSGEPSLKEAFKQGEDVHLRAASLAFGVPLDKVTPEQRQNAKAVGFGLIYQQGPKALGESLGISTNEAKAIQEKYLSGLPAVKKWFSEVKSVVGEEVGYGKIQPTGAVVHNPMGRRIMVWDVFHPNKGVRAKGLRTAVNFPVQGHAADYLLLGMVLCANTLREKGWWGTKVRMLMNQHDSLVFEVRNDMDMNEVKDVIQKTIQYPLPSFFGLSKDFPKMDTDWEVGLDWGDRMVSYDESHLLDITKAGLEITKASASVVTALTHVIRRHKGEGCSLEMKIGDKVVEIPMQVTLNDKFVKDVTKAGAVFHEGGF